MKISDVLSKRREFPHRPRRAWDRLRSRGVALAVVAVLAGLACGSCDQPQLAGQGEGADTPPLALSDRAAPSSPFERSSSENAFPPPSPALGDSGSSSLSVTYPLDFTLENPDGRRLSGVVLGKEGDEIAFRRDLDNGEFVIPLAGLSAASREALSALPDGEIEQLETLRYREVEVEIAAVPERRPTLGNDFLETVEEALERAQATADGERHVLVSFLGRNESASGECASNSGST